MRFREFLMSELPFELSSQRNDDKSKGNSTTYYLEQIIHHTKPYASPAGRSGIKFRILLSRES
jgi:hypothetical protein